MRYQIRIVDMGWGTDFNRFRAIKSSATSKREKGFVFIDIKD